MLVVADGQKGRASITLSRYSSVITHKIQDFYDSQGASCQKVAVRVDTGGSAVVYLQSRSSLLPTTIICLSCQYCGRAFLELALVCLAVLVTVSSVTQKSGKI